MIIFGFRSFVKTLAMLTMVCGRCRNPAAHRLVQRSRWFTLFFIPVIPFSFTRYSTCTFCGATHKISKDDVQQMIDASASGPAPVLQRPDSAASIGVEEPRPPQA